ncbi:MAG: OmpH family outer membrane protein [Ferruginibacter sp.]
MQKIHWFIHGILAVAVGFLFFKQFSSNTQATGSTNAKSRILADTAKNNGPLLIAYVNTDTLFEKIPYIVQKQKELESEQQSIENEYLSSAKNLKGQEESFIKNNPNPTQQQVEQIQNSLMQQKMSIDQKKESRLEQLSQKNIKLIESIKKELNAYVQEYNKDNRFRFIFTTSGALEYMLYKDATYDITEDILAGLKKRLETMK